MKVLLALLLALCLVPLHAKNLKVLTVGNSFSQSLEPFLRQVTHSAGDTILLQPANIGGCSLVKHWTLAEKSASDPTVKPYWQYRPKLRKYSLQEILKEQKWDVVTIQQVSGHSWKPETYQPYADNLVKLIRELAPSAEIVMQETWAYREDEGRLRHWKMTPDQMHEKVAAAYAQQAKHMNIRLLPTGHAVQLARKTQKQPLQLLTLKQVENIKHPQRFPEDPGALHTGYIWLRRTKKDGTKYMKRCLDGAHLNTRGKYLQACVWYGFLFQKPVDSITFVPAGITPEDAKFLRDVAQKTLDDFKQPAR